MFALRPAALAACVALAAAPLGAQTTRPPATSGGMAHARAAGHEAEARTGAWPEMDAFHQVLHAAWHPAVERGDLAPARARAHVLRARAVAWARSETPAACAAAPRGAVAAVAATTRDFAAVARGGSDAQARTTLRTMHDRFELVERACTGHGDAEHAGHRGR